MSQPPASPAEFVLTLRCPDRPGIVHAVSGFLLARGGNIVASAQYGDVETSTFFMRVQFVLAGVRSSAGSGSGSGGGGVSNGDVAEAAADLRAAFAGVCEEFAMTWSLAPATTRERTLILVSQHGHCLNDLLFRWSTGALAIDVAAIVSNHRDFERLATTYGIPFHHIPVKADTKAAAEQELLALVDDLDVQLVVLARYMQVLSDDVCRRLAGRAINIHHSFLPSFKGARPYHQAHARGVKIIGATAHYVTADLDEGPIIDQDVARVDHTMTPEQLVTSGREIESRVLSRAVRLHAERRVLLNGSKTVVFP